MKLLAVVFGVMFLSLRMCISGGVNLTILNGTNTIALTLPQLNAASVALADFKSSHTNEDVSHYHVYLSENLTNVVIAFSPGRGGVEYTVSKQTGKIVKVQIDR